MDSEITDASISARLKKIDSDAEKGGYHLNPDLSFTTGLVEGLLINRNRYGYESCPCRLASGEKKRDIDIICPCDYRDPDLNEYGTCYCGLYVSSHLISLKQEIPSIPERRPPRGESVSGTMKTGSSDLPYPVWRCRVCGYLCARDKPPEICPICKAGEDRFEQFL